MSTRSMSENSVMVPNVIGMPVLEATPTLDAAQLVPHYTNQQGQPIPEPDTSWYVQLNGQSPPGGSEVTQGAIITLIIAAKVPPDN